MNKKHIYSLAVCALIFTGSVLSMGDDKPGRGRGSRGMGYGRGWEGRRGGRGFGMGPGMFMINKQNLRTEIKTMWEKYEELEKYKRTLRGGRMFGPWAGEQKKMEKRDWGRKGGKRGEGRRGEGRRGEGRKGRYGRGDGGRPAFSEEQKANFAKMRKEHAEKIMAKMKELGLTLDACSKLRDLKKLTLEERFAINIMENQIIMIQLRQQGKGLKIEDIAEPKSEYTPDPGNEPVGDEPTSSTDVAAEEPQPEF